MKEAKLREIPAKPFLPMILNVVFAIVSGLCGLFAVLGPTGTHMAFVLLFIVFLVFSMVFGYRGLLFARNALKHIKKLVEDGEYYKAILDGIPFPVHATDNNMKWTFINKAFEKLLVDSKKINGREASYGMACCNAGANICNTADCGIKQLGKGVNESYFTWLGKKCKQGTAPIVDSHGTKLGYVETVTDLTNMIEASDYSKIEVARLKENLAKLASGNLDLDLSIGDYNSNTQESHDLFETIYASLLQVKNAIKLMTSDAETLCGAAIEGRLEARVDAAKHSGEYKNVIDGINKTLEAIVTPLNVASDYIYKMANGERFSPIDNIYKGDYAKLIDSIDSVRQSLDILIGESNKLAQAGRSGDMTVRGCTDGIKGGYTKIIDSVNDTLDSFTKPLSEATVILSKMAANDFTEKMSSDHIGMIGTLAESVNQVHQTFISIEDLLVKTSKGDFSRLAEFKNEPKRSENDKLRPACTAMMQSVSDIVAETNKLADGAADGNLSIRGDFSKFEGTYGQVIVGINRMIEAIGEPVNDSISVLEQWATGDLSAKITKKYKGDYAKMTASMNATATAFRELLTSINEAATQVATGSQEIASGSQNLSQGATEQASSLQELTASISEIASQTKQNAKNAATAKMLSANVHDEAVNGNDKMKQMQKAMTDISESSANIAKIIKVIDDIAFQTNILALNAAVEAARAGQAGKGFAVVADEVRNLAAKSAKAAKETTDLIENSIQKVDTGTSIANATAKALELIVSSIEKSTSLVGEISEASLNQATGISQIDKGLEQVSTVVQTNSATAEQSAAASIELSSQAESLNQMVSQFKLGNSQDSPAVTPKPVPAVKPASEVRHEFSADNIQFIKEKKPTIELNPSEHNKYGEF